MIMRDRLIRVWHWLDKNGAKYTTPQPWDGTIPYDPSVHSSPPKATHV